MSFNKLLQVLFISKYKSQKTFYDIVITVSFTIFVF
jgi:hypothetical protein